MDGLVLYNRYTLVMLHIGSKVERLVLTDPKTVLKTWDSFEDPLVGSQTPSRQPGTRSKSFSDHLTFHKSPKVSFRAPVPHPEPAPMDRAKSARDYPNVVSITDRPAERESRFHAMKCSVAVHLPIGALTSDTSRGSGKRCS